MNKKITVYLADLANTKFGYSPSTVPLGIGYIKAYAMSQLSNEVDIQLHRTFGSLYQAIQTKEPDIIGCSWYGWNRYLTPNALTYIKSHFPNIMTVVGGANVPDDVEGCLRDFKEFLCIDMMIPNEGEIPFVNVLNGFIREGREAVLKTPIDGVYISDSGERVITGNSVPLTKDINIFPSPYLQGYLDQFLDGELMPVLQASRGCPFRCAFCVAAKNSWNKIRAFAVERVKAEINYLEFHSQHRTFRFTDENFGILESDLEIARFIAEKRKKTDYPSAVRVYTHKDINDRIKEMVVLLRDLIPMNISFQTLTKSVLKNIGRKNINLEKVRDAVNWAHKHNINATTELIFGLPGETYGSFMEVINRLTELRFDSVVITSLVMLKETKINHPEIIDEYGYKVLYGIAERGYTMFDQFENVEIDALAVESKTFSFEEYLKIRLFIMVYTLFMFWGYFKELVYIWESRNVKITNVVSEILNRGVAYPLLSQQLGRLRTCIQENLFETKEEAYRVFSQRLSGNNASDQYIGFMSPYILSAIIGGEMIHPSNQEELIHEVIQAATTVFDRCGTGDRNEFLEEMRFAKVLIKNIIIPFWEMPQETAVIPVPYDLVAWRNQNYQGTLSAFTLPHPVKSSFQIHSLNQYRDFIQENSTKPFYLQSEFFFRTFRTVNIRRYMIPQNVKKS